MLKPSVPRLANAINWSSTLSLPRSTFPPRALEAARPTYLRQCTDDLYAWQSTARQSQKPFVLHDGPPYANGKLHIGHALNKILKDVICRFHVSQGQRVHYRPGWDCHGLPIEIKALQADGKSGQGHRDMDPVDVRRRARKLAENAIEDQKKVFKEWGVLGDWQNAYMTMDSGFEIKQLRVFQNMVEKGLIYRDFKPVYWSPSSGTALAEAELEYDEAHVSHSAYIKYKLDSRLSQRYGLNETPVYAMIWTTTPWTVPANRAIAIHKNISYSIVRLLGSGEALLIATARLPDVLESAQKKMDQIEILVADVSGEDLLGTGGVSYVNPFSSDQVQPILHADFVSEVSGTGLVHIAPGHGFDDYKLCREHGIPAFAPVDGQGRFTNEALSSTPNLLEGKDVMTDGQNDVLEWLKSSADPDVNLVWATDDYTHKYPIDWRTKLPVIIRATAQWFAEVDSIKDRALQALQGVRFLPKSGKSRLEGFVLGRSQWCISRQRAWGVPIPVLYDSAGRAVIEAASVEHIIKTIEQRGIDAWWADAADDPAWVAQELEEDKYTRGGDTMDVWFDSGTTWNQIPAREGEPRADVCIEGTDQHRGWFQSSLLTYVAHQASQTASGTQSPVHAPFKTLITHGFTLDAAGRKMSKSIGNVISPDEIMSSALLPPLKKRKGSKGPSGQMDGMGPDALRLWVATSDYTKDVSVSETVLKGVNAMLHKYRVTFKWLLGALADYEPAARHDEEPIQHLADQLALAHLTRTIHTAHTAYAAYDFNKAISSINNYINNDLSSFYFEIAKDPLYTGDTTNRLRVQTTCFQILQGLLQILGPTLPLLVTEVVDHASPTLRSLVLAGIPVSDDAGANKIKDPPPHALLSRAWGPVSASSASDAEAILARHAHLSRIHDTIKTLLESARNDRRIGSGLESRVVLVSSSEEIGALSSAELSEELAEMFVVSGVGVEIVGVDGGRSGVDDGAWCYRDVVDVDFEGGKKARVVVEVRPPSGDKCPRCWRWVVEKERKMAEREEICGRCERVLHAKGVEWNELMNG